MPRFEDTLEELYVPDRAAWRAWLAENHATSPGIWFVFYKKHTGQPTVAYPDLVKEALCFGWIDSKIKTLDADRYRQIVTPRKPKSAWSKINKGYVEELLAEGLLSPAGLAKIEAAQNDGSWTALDAVEAGIIPADLQAALTEFPPAQRGFDALSASHRKRLLFWMDAAKRPETRRIRIEQTLHALERGSSPLEP